MSIFKKIIQKMFSQLILPPHPHLKERKTEDLLWPMKVPKALGTISLNSSTDFIQLKTKTFVRKLERIQIELYSQNESIISSNVLK